MFQRRSFSLTHTHTLTYKYKDIPVVTIATTRTKRSTMLLSWKHTVVSVVAAAVATASSAGFASAAALGPSDPVVVGQTFTARSLDPTDGSAGWALTSHGVAEKLFTVDEHGEIVPQVAESVTKLNELTWTVTLKEGYKFSDGTIVDPKHVADCLNDLNAKNSNAKSSLGTIIATPSAQGDNTVRIESERPTHVMDAVLAEWVFVIYNLDETSTDGSDKDAVVFTGPYVIETYDPDSGAIDLVPNPYYHDGKSLERPLLKIQKFSNGHELAESVQNHEVDIGFHLPIDTLPELREEEGVSVKSFEVGYHYMMFHNTDEGKPLHDVRVRKAVDVAIDRTVLSQALSGGKATRSLFPDYSPYFLDGDDQTKDDPHGDADSSASLLDEAGWLLNTETGKREKTNADNGETENLTLTLVAYPHRPGLGIMQPFIEESLTDLGITVTSILTSQEWSDTQTIIDDRSFDLLMWAQHTLPAGDPLWFLSAFFRSDGGNNHSNLSSGEVDAMLDALSEVEDHQERIAVTNSVHTEILGMVPVSNLLTPYWHVSLSDRMADYKPWGSDYYVIRDDLFLSVVEEDGVKTASSPTTEGESDGDDANKPLEDPSEDSSSGVVPMVTGTIFAVVSALGLLGMA